MKRIIWIPIAGTIAAILAVLVTHQAPPKEEETAPAAGAREAHEPAPVEAVHYVVEYREDGSFAVKGRQASYKSAADLLAAIAPEGAAPPVVTLENASGKVTKEALAKAAKDLAPKAKVTQRYRAAKEKGE